MDKTQPFLRYPQGVTPNSHELTAGRYGTHDMAKIWGPDETIHLSLKVQGISARLLASLHPEIVSGEEAEEIFRVATSGIVTADRVREIEVATGHDIIGINNALGEHVSPEAQRHINKAKTSADTTQPVRALQLKSALEIIIIVTENIRDIMCEKVLEWKDTPFMDTTHLYDAIPTLAARPFAHYIEMLQSNITFLSFILKTSILGKWADATGNHHSAAALGIDGMELQKAFCEEIGVGYMDAPGQVPGLEFEADIFYGLSRLSETLNNIAKFIATGRGDDTNIFKNGSPQKQKGSSAMPHKDAKNGNPTTEEQTMSLRSYSAGNLTTAMMNCEIPYARNLSASANTRINFEDGFKFLDHVMRNFSKTIYWLELNEERSKERVLRSFGVITSQQVMTYLTDPKKTSLPMSRTEAHDLTGQLAKKAWDTKTQFVDVVLGCKEITTRLDEKTIRDITNPLNYIGQSREVIDTIISKYYKTQALPKDTYNSISYK